MSKCAFNKCQNKSFGNLDKCALHCNKNDYHTDWQSGLLAEFKELLCNYVLSELAASDYRSGSLNRSQLDELIELAREKNDGSNGALIKAHMVLSFIVFPQHDDRDFFDYSDVLCLFESIHFNYCEFYCTVLELNETQVFFQDCKFHTNWMLFNYKLLANIDDVIYQSCEFYLDVTSELVSDEARVKINNNQFDFGCVFHSKLSINNVDMDAELFSSRQLTEKYSLIIKELMLSNVRVGGKFIINNLEADSVRCEDIEFGGKFELKNSTVKNVLIYNANFAKVSDFFGSKFCFFKIYKSVFLAFSVFEKCQFGSKNTLESRQLAEFQYTTFFDFVSFRNTMFHSGLRIDEANFKMSANFLNTVIDDKFTNRESYRIIKHSFDSEGNRLEANRYYSLELKKYKEELYSKGHVVRNKLTKSQVCQQRFVFFVNEFGSGFGQNFYKPVFLMICLTIVFAALLYAKENNWLYKIYPEFNHVFSSVSGFLNWLAKAMIPFRPLQVEGMEFLTIIFGVIFSVLIWLTITAVKMHTKR